MILAIDVGNTETLIGVFKEDELTAHWRLATRQSATSDELTIALAQLFGLVELSFSDVDGVVLSSVVPALTSSWKQMSRMNLAKEVLVVTPELEFGMTIRYDNPAEVGADRIANALAASRLYGNPVIVVDFGTATTFDVVSPDGEYVGGAIAPGLLTSSEALFKGAARLAKVELVSPSTVIGTNTEASLQAGILLGKAALVDGLLRRIKIELEIVSTIEPTDPKVVATGGLAELVVPHCDTPMEVNPLLSLQGLRMIKSAQNSR